MGPLNQDIAVGEWGTIPSEATVNSSFNRSEDDWKRPYLSDDLVYEPPQLLRFDPPVLTLFSLLLELPVTYGIHEIPILLTVGWIHSPAFLTSKGG